MSMVRTEPEEYIAIGWRGVEALRVFPGFADEHFFPGEFISTTDQHRFFLVKPDKTCELVNTVRHTAATETAMLALNSTSGRGCHPGDRCERTDQEGAVYECLSNNGETDTDWKPVASGAASLVNAGRWEPVTNGDPDATELVFDGAGDVVMGFVTD